jgi:hypothetical protein
MSQAKVLAQVFRTQQQPRTGRHSRHVGENPETMGEPAHLVNPAQGPQQVTSQTLQRTYSKQRTQRPLRSPLPDWIKPFLLFPTSTLNQPVNGTVNQTQTLTQTPAQWPTPRPQPQPPPSPPLLPSLTPSLLLTSPLPPSSPPLPHPPNNNNPSDPPTAAQASNPHPYPPPP